MELFSCLINGLFPAVVHFIDMKKAYTLCMVLEDDEILLGFKKRGFGAGYYNGFGGKVESGETVVAAARRELLEEAGIIANELDLAGILDFTFAHDEKELEVYVYKVTKYDGVAAETEEMRPVWFKGVDIPYQQMWPDDVYWLPLLLTGKCFRGAFHFDQPATIDQEPVILRKSLRTFDTAWDVSICERVLK